MEKIKRFIDCYIPTETCNFRCHYCYVTQHRKFNNKIAKFNYDPSYIRKALSRKRLGGICLFNLCAGGETLLSEDVVKITKELLEEGHYVMIVTNGSLTKRFQEISEFGKEQLSRLFFKFSFHYMELKRLNLLNTFFKNVELMEKAGASYTLEITPTDELEPYINEIKEVCMEKNGALPHITIGRKDSEDIPVLTEHNFEDYKKIWKTFDSKLFDFKSEIFGKKRKEFCYAGDWSVYLNLITGDMRQCYCGKVIDNIYKNPEQPIKFCAIGNNCTMPHCYNGHAFLALGDIPELETPKYSELRNRKKKNGDEWLKDEMKSFMSNKLNESNEEYSNLKKTKINLRNKPIKVLKSIKRKLVK